jgi:hypothetical protein
VPTFSLVVSVRYDVTPSDDVVDALRRGDDGPMVWRDADPAVLRVSTECAAADLDHAVAVGLGLGDDVLAGAGGVVQEVVAMDDEQQLVWRAEP